MVLASPLSVLGKAMVSTPPARGSGAAVVRAVSGGAAGVQASASRSAANTATPPPRAPRCHRRRAAIVIVSPDRQPVRAPGESARLGATRGDRRLNSRSEQVLRPSVVHGKASGGF